MTKAVYSLLSLHIGCFSIVLPFSGFGQYQGGPKVDFSENQVISTLDKGDNTPGFVLMVPAADLNQYRNGSFNTPINTCANWVSGNADEQNAHYMEGWSIPYRCVMTDLPLNTSITVTLGYDIRHSNKNALDYLTYFHRMAPHDIFCDSSHQTPECVIPDNGAFSIFPIPAPSSAGSPMPGMPTNSFNSLPAGERVMVLYGGIITNIVYNTQGDLNAVQSETTIDVTFTVTQSLATLAWGGHIASRLDWGAGNSASGISGAPYHMRLIDWTLNNLSSQDRSLSAGAVGSPCFIDGPDNVCPGATSQHCASPGANSWLWTISGDAVIVGPADQACVTVSAANNCDSSYTLTLNAENDTCGFSCTKTILINDVTPPTVTCLADTIVSCTNQLPPLNPGILSVSDNCGGPVTTSFVNDIIFNNLCPNKYLLVRIYKATDACGNSATCSRKITVFDQTSPTIICATQPSPVECTGGALQWLTPTVSDACDTLPVVTYSDVTTPGACAQEYSVTRTWTATDACMNASTCSSTITVVDNTAPDITCAAQQTPVECAGGTLQWLAPTVSDACDTLPVVTFSDVTTPGACAQEYSVTRTWTATDACMNVSSCSSTISVEDNTAPVITCATQQTPVECTGGALQWVAPTVSDACDTLPVVTFSDVTTPGACAQEYSVTRTWTASDACMNVSTCSSTITVEDSTAPDITCTSQQSPVECTGILPWNAPTVTDACDAAPVVTFNDVTTPGACEYLVTRTWTATDACMNASTCSSTITVDDNTAPDITCATQPSSIECTGSAVQWVTPTVTDACDAAPVITFSDVTTPGACTQEYSVTRTWAATDACMNASTCSSTITVEDNTAPVVTCATQTSPVECTGGALQWVAPTVTDACDTMPVVTFSDVTTPGACAQEYSVTRTWTATDACMNASSCSSTISVEDNTAPVVTCATQTSPVECTGGALQWVAPTVTDACDAAPVVTFSDVTTPGACEYLVTRIWTATDACMNASSCSSAITVDDNTAPDITCATQPSPVECTGGALQWVAPTVTDACDTMPVVTFSDVTTPGACAQEYSVTRTWTATDACMNASSCSSTISVEDNTAPVVTCATQTSPVECPGTLQWVEPTVTDACDVMPVVTFSDMTMPGACALEYIVTRTWTATDACMNASTCSSTISVEDQDAPTAYFIVNGIADAAEAYEICGEVTLLLDRAGVALGQPLTIMLSVSGTATSGADFSPLNTSYTIPAGEDQLLIPIAIVDDMLTENPESIVLTLVNTCSCDTTEKMLTILDTITHLTLTCPPNLNVTVNPPVVTYPLPVAMTDCPCPGVELELTEGLPSGSVFPLGLTKVCYLASDSCGNTATCCFDVNVLVPPDAPCDEATNGCIKYEFLSNVENAAGENTYTFRITNNCGTDNKLMYAAFSLPSAVVALAPPDNSVYTAPSGREYNVRNPNYSPFYSIRFYSAIVGIANGESDIFEFTLPTQAYPEHIHVIVRLTPKIFNEAYLTCPDGSSPKPDQDKSGNHLTVFPNPTTGQICANLSDWKDEQVQVQLFDSRGQRILQHALTATSVPQEIQLPKDLYSGLYFLEFAMENGEKRIVRFVVQY